MKLIPLNQKKVVMNILFIAIGLKREGPRMEGKLIERIIWLAVTVIITGWSIVMFMEGMSTKVFMGVLTIISLFIIGLGQSKSQKTFFDSICDYNVYVYIHSCRTRYLWRGIPYSSLMIFSI